MKQARITTNDLKSLQDGDRVLLHPRPDNPIHKQPKLATYSGGYFFCDDSDPEGGPDYYVGDVLAYNERIEVIND